MCIFNSKNPFLQNIRHFLVVQQARAVSRKRGCTDSSDTEQVTSSLALVRTMPMPPPPLAATTLSASGRQRSGTMTAEYKYKNKNCKNRND